MDPLGDDLHMRDMDQDDEAKRQEVLGMSSCKTCVLHAEDREPCDHDWEEYYRRENSNATRQTYYNSNGLVDGEIPAGSPCPFLEGCRVRIERCPQPGNLKPHTYSCAAARLQSSLLEGK